MYNKLHIFKAYNLISFDISICPEIVSTIKIMNLSSITPKSCLVLPLPLLGHFSSSKH